MLENNQTKVCTECCIEKKLSAFYLRKVTQKYRGKCKDCETIRNQKYYQKNREKITDRNKQYFDSNKDKWASYYKKHNEADKEKSAARAKEWRKNNKVRYALTQSEHYYNNKDKYIARAKAYSQTKNGRAISRNASHRRRSLKKQGDVTSKQLLELEQNAKVCYWCNEPLKNKKVHIDHYIPLSKGGEHTINNLVISCSKCNLTKNAKDPILFANSIGKLF